jgi:pilus assembly protein Flp/PilA
MAYLSGLISYLLDRDEEGQGLAEYALILVLIAIVAIVALIFLGGQVSKILSTVGASVYPKSPTQLSETTRGPASPIPGQGGAAAHRWTGRGT